MALVGPSPCWWREAMRPLPKRGVRLNASGTARGRADATGLSQRSWWLRVNSSTVLRASSQDGHGARDEEFSARRGMEDVDIDADTASARPPTPAPVFRRRPKPKRGRGRPRLPKPPPRYPPPDQSAVSLQASRQQNALFKGLARQMTGLSALGLPNSPELQRWRAIIEEDHRARRPGRKPKGSGVGSAAATKKKQKQNAETDASFNADARRSRRRRTCGVCGGEGHNARTCALASSRREDSSSDLVSYYEAKYGDRLNEPRGDPNGGGLVSRVSRRDEDEKKRKKNRPVGRPRASLSIAVRCSACGKLGHNRRFHETKRDFNKSRPGPQNPCTCSWCGEKGHNSRGCPARRGAAAGYGFKYGYAYGRAYGYRYGFGTGAGGWVPFSVSDSWNDEAFSSEKNENENADVTRTRTRTRLAVRSKPLELRAATLWLRSRARSADPEKKDALSVGEACARVGVAARFKQNVWNATKRARASGWVDDGAADEFLNRPEAEFEEATSAEGEAAAREA